MKDTLWSKLQERKIEIPIIQRDYAQGRIGKEHLRERFLGEMIAALQGKRPPMTLDFVYGTVENGALWPLDGQQRLTTLWLLHWYIAVRTGHLAENKNTFLNFTYETRISSREFCEHLCSLDADDFNAHRNMGIVGYIQNQTWFYNKYTQDPTIQGMLRTLGGTSISNSKGEDIRDGIEEFLKDNNNCESYWQQLISPRCPITFVYKEMKDENLPLSDDLYIKMNARGKQLTDFENFKADLIDFAPDPDKPQDKLLDISTASLIDNEWTDVFWKEASRAGIYKVDDLFFTFLRRYFLNKFIATSTLKSNELQEDKFYKYVYKGEGKEEGYTGFGIYRHVLNDSVIEDLKLFFRKWKASGIDNNDLQPLWSIPTDFCLIPQYGKEDSAKVSTVSRKGRVVSYAVCCYFEENESYNKEYFKDWLRFVWNVAENGNLYDEGDMINAIRIVHELRTRSGDILSFLASDEKIHSTYARIQIAEERFKAKLLLGEESKVWKQAIIEAESNNFFKGNISCLLRHGSKKYVDDIECFKKKYRHACDYFNADGLKDELRVEITLALIKCCHRWEQICYGDNWMIFDSSAYSWKQRILNTPSDKQQPDYYREVDSLLSVDDLGQIQYCSIIDKDDSSSESKDKIKKILSSSEILNDENVFDGSSWRLRKYANAMAFYKYNGRNAYIFDWYDKDEPWAIFKRNELLHHDSIIVDKDMYPKTAGIYWGRNICFKYHNYHFLWQWDNTIYLTDEDGIPIEKKGRQRNGKDDYFVINMGGYGDITQTGFLRIITRLGREYCES